ncbi:methyltransferase family protein [Nocardia concava]|uniref:methyltransferase family protein n=1 Tax=Nocardia concava TaxID=257281 RepID=UPI0002D59103|nr:isoprenylcysteine carboxylmethyltransferase family protein [Nocardia concava]
MAGNSTSERGARVIYIPPPLYYVAAVVGGMALNSVVPLPIGGRPATEIAGVVIVALGLTFAWCGVGAVIRHRTTIVPHRPVSTLITTGVYRVSRNPMYTGLAVAALGLGLLVNSWWPIALLPVAIALVLRLVIEPEERYLTERFGQSYLDYRGRVGRWLGRAAH